ncbi:hypothetical protein GCM10023405_19170 [Streptomonospora salina]
MIMDPGIRKPDKTKGHKNKEDTKKQKENNKKEGTINVMNGVIAGPRQQDSGMNGPPGGPHPTDTTDTCGL